MKHFEDMSGEELQGAWLQLLINTPAYRHTDGTFEYKMAAAINFATGLLSPSSREEILQGALDTATEWDRKVKYEGDIQEHVAAGGKYVNIYVLDHDNYGGPEEGGWHYTSGTPMSIGHNLAGDPVKDYRYHSDDNVRGTTKVHALDNPRRVCEEIHKAIDSAGTGLERGEYVVKVEDRPAEYWPAVKPHYQ